MGWEGKLEEGRERERVFLRVWPLVGSTMFQWMAVHLYTHIWAAQFELSESLEKKIGHEVGRETG